MAKTRTGLIVALDVGSTKVSCLVARANADGAIRVIGMGHNMSGGVRAGAVVDMEATETSILAAVGAAEEMSGERLRGATVNISGGEPSSRIFAFEVAINGHEIADADLRGIHRHWPPEDETAGREMIHCIPTGYSIDGNRGIRDPRGMFGQRLGVNVHLVTVGAGAYRNLSACVARCHLEVEDVVLSPYASGLACLVEDERDLGATVVDMGGGTTTLGVFQEGHVVYADAIPIGGAHVTNDIARGLSTPIAHAERMKALYGGAIPSAADDREVIDVPLVGEDNEDSETLANHVPRSMLVGIIRPRLEEIFELVRGSLETAGASRIGGRRLVLTGGASQLQGARELAALILEKQVRIGRPLRIGGLAEAASGPAFSTCAGLLRYAVERQGTVSEAPHAAAEPQVSRFARLGHWLKESF